MKLDAHQHFWVYNATQHAWIDDSMHAIQRDFLPADLEPLLQVNGFDGCISVQVDQTEADTAQMLQWAAAHPFIKGVVGWVDLQAPDCEAKLEQYQTNPMLKGFRHIVQGETDPQFLHRPAFRAGIALLQRFGFTYDILIYPHQLPSAIAFAAAFPQQPFVLDHLAKPYIKKGLINEWHADLKKLAALDNVWCKVSGLVTEADWQHHQPADFTPYIEAALETFGPNRLLFGSDWPVCLVAASYHEVVQLAHGVFKKLSADEQKKIWGANAMQFYKVHS